MKSVCDRLFVSKLDVLLNDRVVGHCQSYIPSSTNWMSI